MSPEDSQKTAPPGDDDAPPVEPATEETAADAPMEEPAPEEPHDATFEDDVEGPPEPPPSRGSRLTGITAFAALVLSLVALAGVGYLALTDGEPADAGIDPAYVDSLAESIRDNDASLAELERRLAALPAERPAPAGEPGVSAAELDALERRLAAQFDALDAMPARLASLESAMSTLRGISTGARDAWLLAEAEYYLQIANAQLNLAGNPQVATMALRIADERLLELGDPGLTDVRRALADELASLAAVESPDIEGATLTLASLSRVVESLPIRSQILTDASPDDAPEGELTGTDRAVQSLKNAFSGIVSVRRTDEAARPLIAPDAVYFLRANLSLQLQAARLALLRGEQALFQQSLDDAAAWLREYYDTESQPVRSALQTIGEIRDSSFARALPDISASLRLLRQYMAFIEAGRSDVDDNLPDADAEPPQ